MKTAITAHVAVKRKCWGDFERFVSLGCGDGRNQLTTRTAGRAAEWRAVIHHKKIDEGAIEARKKQSEHDPMKSHQVRRVSEHGANRKQKREYGAK